MAGVLERRAVGYPALHSMAGTRTVTMSQVSQANASGDDAAPEHSTAELVKQMTEQVSTLLRDADARGMGRAGARCDFVRVDD